MRVLGKFQLHYVGYGLRVHRLPLRRSTRNLRQQLHDFITRLTPKLSQSTGRREGCRGNSPPFNGWVVNLSRHAFVNTHFVIAVWLPECTNAVDLLFGCVGRFLVEV